MILDSSTLSELEAHSEQQADTSEDTHLTKTALIARGWTAKAVRDFAGEPHETAVNPHYRSGPRVQLWRKGFIEEVESSEPFKEFCVRNEGRRQGAQRATEKKRDQLKEEVASLKIKVRQMPTERLVKDACAHYNRIQGQRAMERVSLEFNPASPQSDPDFLARICVNFLRHQCSKYEDSLDTTKGRVGVYDAFLEISRKVYREIGDKYPHLKDEAERQLMQRTPEQNELEEQNS